MRKNIGKRIVTMMASALLGTTLFLTGCGQEKPEVNLSVWGAVEDQAMLHKMVEEFAAHYGNEAKFHITISEESEMTCRDTIMNAPELAADVFAFAGDQFYDLAREGALHKVTEDVDVVTEACGGKESAIIDAASFDGSLYAYPMTASNGYFLFYDSRYLSAEDVRDMDKMLEKAASLGKKVSMEMESGWYLYSFFKAAGLDVELNDDNVTHTCNWNATSGAYRGADVLQRVMDIAAHPGFVSLSSDNVVEQALKGNVIAAVSGTWNAIKFEEAYKEGYEATILPTFAVAGQNLQMHSVTGYKMVGVSAYTKEEVWAQRLAEWITNEENQITRFKERGEGPANMKAVQAEDVQKSKAIAALSSQAEYAHIQKVGESYWTESYKLGTIISAGNPEKKGMQQLLDELVGEITTSSK